MNYASEFKKKPLEERLKKAEEILENNPNRIPIILTVHPNSKNIKIDKVKFLIPKAFTINHLAQTIRKQIKINSDTNIYFYYNNQLLKNNGKLLEYYDLYKEKDNFFYLQIGELTSYGNF